MSVSIVETVEVVNSDLQERLQPTMASGTGVNGAVLRKRGEGFSFKWPFVSKDMASQSSFSGRTTGYKDPQSLSERCGQLLRQFPSYFSSRALTSSNSDAIRDTIERSLTEARAAWLVVAVYFALALLSALSIALGVAFVGASKPAGLWFLVVCIATTGAIACSTMRTQPCC